MTDEERKAFRRKLGQAILDIQEECAAAGMPVTVFLPEMIAALMSAAAYIAHQNAHLGKGDWQKMQRTAAQEQWPS